MHWLTEDALVVCKHQLGKVANAPSQNFVRIDARRVLVDSDPERRPIAVRLPPLVEHRCLIAQQNF